MRDKFKLICVSLLLSTSLYGQIKEELLKEVDALAQLPADSASLGKLSDLIMPLLYFDIDTAWHYVNYTYEASKSIGFVSGQISTLGHMSFILYNQNKYAGALDYALNSLELAQSYGKNYDYIVTQQNTIGRIYDDLGDHEKALEFFEKSIKHLDSVRGFGTRYFTYFSIAKVYRNIEDYDQSNSYFQQARAFAEASENPSKIARAINQIGRNFFFQEEYDSALIYIHKAIDLRNETQDYHGLINSERDLGVVYGRINQFDLALEYLFSSLSRSDSLQLPFGSLPTLKQIADVYKRSNDCESAIKYLNTAYEKAATVGRSNEMREILKELIENHTNCDQFQKIPPLFSLYDSLVQLTHDGKDLMTMEARYQLELNQKELQRKNEAVYLLSKQEQAEQNFNLVLMISVFLLLVSLGLIYLRYRSSLQSRRVLHTKNTMIESQNQQIEEMNEVLERKLLRAQMNPHFVFNALNSIQHFITISDKKSTLNYLSKFSRLIRQTLEHSLVSWVSIAEEVSLLKNYIELEMLRLNHAFDYHIEIDDNLNIEHVEIPFLIIQPYVENAINHGLRSLSKPGFLLVKIEDHVDKIICIVEDNGIGREASNAMNKKRQQKSRGMSVTEKRIELLNADFQNAASVKVFDLVSETEAAGTKVEISIAKKMSKVEGVMVNA